VLPGLWEDIGLLPDYLAATDPPSGFFWLGPAGTVTPLHHDLTNNFMAQVVGRKRVLMAPTISQPHLYNYLHVFSRVDLARIDYQQFPEMRQVRVIECILEPGQILFLPVGCWHQVEALDLSVTMTFTNFLLDNDFSTFYRADGEL
jgi:ribosomal protein L16 Arg81 hydroxylase